MRRDSGGERVEINKLTTVETLEPGIENPKSKIQNRNRLLQFLLLGYALLWLVLAISPFDRSDWLLENLLVFVSVGFLIATHRRLPLSNLSYVLITIFLALHAVGAHYTYEHVPLGDWLRRPLGFTRNNFDRLVHFLFGLLLTYPFAEALHRVIRIAWRWAFLFSFLIVLAASSFFELLESWVAQVVSPALGTAYLGTQGDVWDAQKDMTAALLGSLLALGTIWIARRVKR